MRDEIFCIHVDDSKNCYLFENRLILGIFAQLISRWLIVQNSHGGRKPIGLIASGPPTEDSRPTQL